jgi:hypothetical protein
VRMFSSNPSRMIKSRIALALLWLAWLSASCSHAKAAQLVDSPTVVIADAQISVAHDWAVLHSSHVSHVLWISRPVNPASTHLVMLKHCHAAQRLYVYRCQLAQDTCVRTRRTVMPEEMIVRPGIPPPAMTAA